MMISEKIKFKTDVKELPAIARKIARHKAVKAVYLFGSHALGKTHIHSDIDICIFTEHEAEDATYPVTDNLDVSYFHRLPITLRYRILKEGEPLVVHDAPFIKELQISTLHEYIEFKPALQRFVQETIGCTIP